MRFHELYDQQALRTPEAAAVVTCKPRRWTDLDEPSK